LFFLVLSIINILILDERLFKIILLFHFYWSLISSFRLTVFGMNQIHEINLIVWLLLLFFRFTFLFAYWFLLFLRSLLFFLLFLNRLFLLLFCILFFLLNFWFLFLFFFLEDWHSNYNLRISLRAHFPKFIAFIVQYIICYSTKVVAFF
jgi:hypothetical protein